MERVKKVLIINLGALLCAVWFLAFGWMWTYLVNLIIALPVGVAGFFLWRAGWRHSKTNLLNKVAGVTLLIGLMTSIASAFFYK